MFSADACVFGAFQAGHPKQHPVALPCEDLGVGTLGVGEFGLGQHVRHQAASLHAKGLDAVSSLPRPDHQGKICRRHPASRHGCGGGVGRAGAALHIQAGRAERLWVSRHIFPPDFHAACVLFASWLRDCGPTEVGPFAHDVLLSKHDAPSDLGVFLEQVNGPFGVALWPSSFP